MSGWRTGSTGSPLPSPPRGLARATSAPDPSRTRHRRPRRGREAAHGAAAPPGRAQAAARAPFVGDGHGREVREQPRHRNERLPASDGHVVPADRRRSPERPAHGSGAGPRDARPSQELAQIAGDRARTYVPGAQRTSSSTSAPSARRTSIAWTTTADGQALHGHAAAGQVVGRSPPLRLAEIRGRDLHLLAHEGARGRLHLGAVHGDVPRGGQNGAPVPSSVVVAKPRRAVAR